jgi:hypothetical protein
MQFHGQDIVDKIVLTIETVSIIPKYVSMTLTFQARSHSRSAALS